MIGGCIGGCQAGLCDLQGARDIGSVSPIHPSRSIEQVFAPTAHEQAGRRAIARRQPPSIRRAGYRPDVAVDPDIETIRRTPKRMAPEPKSPLVSAQMSRMPVVGTGPELALRRELHRRGLRFRVAPKHLPGKPDIAFTRARIAVFVSGCFWHNCEQHGTIPKNNREWWEAKFVANRERDSRKDHELEALGWLPVHVWEHDRPEEAAEFVAQLWKSRVRPE